MADQHMPEHFGQQPKASPVARTWAVILGLLLLAAGVEFVAVVGQRFFHGVNQGFGLVAGSDQFSQFFIFFSIGFGIFHHAFDFFFAQA